MTFEEWWAEQKGCKEITKYEAAKNAWYAAKFVAVREQIKAMKEARDDESV